MKNEDYNPTSHTLTILMVLAVCLAVILSLLASCRTIHDTEHVYTHDTLYVNHSDTVREVKVTHHTDTVKQIEKHTYTINNVGDTIKEIHHYHNSERTIVVDSTERYRAERDSLRFALKEEKSKDKTVVKVKLPTWFWPVAAGNFFLFFLLSRRLLLSLLKKGNEEEEQGRRPAKGSI